MNPFEVFLTTPILNLLVVFYKILLALSIPGALGLAIILLTVTIRLILWPLTTAQLKSSQKMAALKPHLDHIKTEHGHDKIRHQAEITKLYKEHGVNPLAGCLPLLLQMPVFIALYNVLLKIVRVNGTFLESVNGKLYSFVPHLEKTPDTSFLGFNLATKPADWHQVGFLILAIPIVTGILQFIQSKMLVPASPALRLGGPNRDEPPTAVPAEKGPAPKVDEGKKTEDTMAQVSSQMAMVMPAMIAFFSYGFPVGLSLYWNTFTVIGIIQQYVVAGPGGLNKYLPAKWRK